MYISQIMYIRPTNTTVAMISWKYDGARFGPKGSRVKSYTPEKVIDVVADVIFWNQFEDFDFGQQLLTGVE